eukprot:SAG22_NODE_470_length_10142_cov_13.947227_2_plen_54_part_00
MRFLAVRLAQVEATEWFEGENAVRLLELKTGVKANGKSMFVASKSGGGGKKKK